MRPHALITSDSFMWRTSYPRLGSELFVNPFASSLRDSESRPYICKKRSGSLSLLKARTDSRVRVWLCRYARWGTADRPGNRAGGVVQRGSLRITTWAVLYQRRLAARRGLGEMCSTVSAVMSAGNAARHLARQTGPRRMAVYHPAVAGSERTCGSLISAWTVAGGKVGVG